MRPSLLAASLLALAGCEEAKEGPVHPERQPAPANRLAGESSPYLLQHARNPVQWHPWGPEALALARQENKPIFLSIGYSACHWCHVMAHESFEDPEVAKAMNAAFVNIKVDREERPDLDEIYMSAVMMMTGQGGWPMSVWLTPDGAPFYGGTYFPPRGRWGRPGFLDVCGQLARSWKENPEGVAQSARSLAESIRSHAALEGAVGAGELDRQPVAMAAQGLKRSYDAEWGGFGEAPKFPPSMDLEVLLREHARTGEAGLLAMAENTLDRMARGGMRDQLGGGFHRYSTDAKWLVPHFEKMLYDNALLARAYLHAWQATGKDAYAEVVRSTLDYVLGEMTSPEGGFFSSQDADSEGEEGRFFVWTSAETEAVLGREAEAFCRAYDITPAGNFEGGRCIPWLPEPPEGDFKDSRGKLFEAREKRVKPHRDEKILVDWNGLMIRAMAECGAALGEPRYVEAARRSADFCLTRMVKDGRLLHTYGGGKAKLSAYLDGHAFLMAGCLALFEATGEERWLTEAGKLAALLEKHFLDPKGGGFFYTADDHEELLVRTKHPGDNAIPSGNSVAAGALLKLASLTGEGKWRDMAEGTLRAFAGWYAKSPRGFAEMLGALDDACSPPKEIVIVGDPGDPATMSLWREVRGRYLPGAVIVPVDPARPLKSPLAEGKGLVGGKPAAYVCSGGACARPVTEAGGMGRALGK